MGKTTCLNEMNSKQIFLFIVVFLIVLIVTNRYVYFRYKSNRKNEKEFYLKNHSKRLIGQNLYVFHNYFKNKRLNYYLLIYHIDDCQSCIIMGKELIIKNQDGGNSYIIELNNSDDKTPNILHNQTIEEKVNDILKAINYIPTPAIIKLDSIFTVRNVYYPGKSIADEFEKFFNN